MSELTPNLGLFKYDITTDGKESFNITQCLNNNWDKIDTGLALKNHSHSNYALTNHTHSGYQSTLISGTNIKTINGNSVLGSGNITISGGSSLPSIEGNEGKYLYTDGETILWEEVDSYLKNQYKDNKIWCRQYSDGWKEQGGYVLSGPTEVKWNQEILTSATKNGTLGGDSFAVLPSSEVTTNMAWKAFDGQKSSTYWSSGKTISKGPVNVIMYFPQPVKIKTFTIDNVSTYHITKGKIWAGNTSETNNVIREFTNSVSTDGWQINVNSTDFYKYYKLEITGYSTTNGNVAVAGIIIDATQIINGGTGVTFPLSFSDTDYTFSLGFQGNSEQDSYINNRTASGFTLNLISYGTICWMACGY